MIVVWRITQRCNLSCPFCEWDSRLPRERLHMPANPILCFGKLLGDYQRQTNDPVLLSWLGGEPTLWPPLYDLAPEIKRLGIAQSTTTNGTTLGSAKVSTLILENFTELTVSVDGFSEFHDNMRAWSGGWEQLRQSVVVLAEKRSGNSPLKLRANVVLMRDNIAVFPDLCEELANWGVDEITFNALGGRDRPEFFPAHRLRIEDVRWLADTFPALKARMAERKVTLCGSEGYLARIHASANNEPLFIQDCGPGQRFLFIDEFGRVSPCNFTTDRYAVHIDEIKSFEDLIALPTRFSQKRQQSLHAACADCPSTQVFAKFSG